MLTRHPNLLVALGVAILVPSLLWLIGGMLGLLPTDAMAVAGNSGLKTIAGIAVAGCLLSAIGGWKQELEK